MKTIGFIGLGLIGGSIARTIRKFHPDYRLLAFDKDRSALAEAVSLNVIDGICDIEDERLYNCDYLFLCAPVEFNVEYMEKIKDSLGENCILTDVGSVKSIIHEKVTELGLEGKFIGGHPMAGSERSGFSNSSDHLLENAYYIITPGGEVALDRISDFTELVSSLGAIPLVLTAEEHDFITAGVSHLPHIVASALVNLVKLLDNDAEYMKMIAAGGFRDITRIASSSPVMWEQICMTNTENILVLLKRYITSLESICDTLENHNGDAIYKMFEESGKYRSTFPNRGQGPIERDYSFCVDVLDEPGSISVLSAILAAKGISVKNIGINHSREEGEGALRISFYKEDKKNEAAELLRSHNYVLTK